MLEVWRQIPGLEWYEASSLGRVRSLDHVVEYVGRWGLTRKPIKGRVLIPYIAKKTGYCYVGIGGRNVLVNRIIAETFIGPCPSPVHEAAHIDGARSNNSESNVVWATSAENASHKIAHGTDPRGSRNPAALLNEHAVAIIIKRYADGVRSDALADEYGVCVQTIVEAVAGRTWKHVFSPYRDAAKRQCSAWQAHGRRPWGS